VYVTEGDRPYDLPLRVWFNRSAICGTDDDQQCNVSLEFEFSDSRDPSNPLYVTVCLYMNIGASVSLVSSHVS